MRILATGLTILFLTLQYDLWFSEGSVTSAWILEDAIASQQEENAQLENRNSAMTAEVFDLRNGRDAFEERARSELGMIKDGESFIQVVD